MHKVHLLIIAILFSANSNADTFGVDIGQTKAVFNRFAIPNNDENRVTLPNKGLLRSYRLTGFFDHGENQIYFL